MEVNGDQQLFGSSKYLPLYSTEERNSYRFAMAWGCVNDDKTFILGELFLQGYFIYLCIPIVCKLIKNHSIINTFKRKK